MKELKSKHFNNEYELNRWVNEEDIQIVAIVPVLRSENGLILFYYTK
jgi:hypothetical protein